jgi:hypothetical protein
MCSGPLLIVLGLIFFVASFSDTRLQLISERNGYVDAWNSGLGAEGADSAFHGMTDLSMVFSLGGSVLGDHVVQTMGSTAPEPVGDTSQRDVESFTEVTEPWYYTLSEPFKYADLGVNNFDNYDDFTTNTVDIMWKKGTVEEKLTTITPVIKTAIPYDWYVSRSSSQSSDSIDCTDPNYDYPGTRFSSKIECDDWCRREGGTWLGGSSCYNQATSGTQRADDSCCVAHWGAVKACFLWKDSNGGEVVNEGCQTSFGSKLSRSSSSNDEYDSAGFENAATGHELGGSLSQLPVLYARYTQDLSSSSRTTAFLPTLEVSVRHETDPYVPISELTGGCTSGTSSKTPIIGSSDTSANVFSEPSGGARCFGLTPEEMRQIALTCFILGGILSIFPCGVIYYLTKKKKGRQPQAYTASSQPQVQAQVVMAPGAYQQQQQFQPVIAQAQYVPQPQPVVVQAQTVPVGGSAQFVTAK